MHLRPEALPVLYTLLVVLITLLFSLIGLLILFMTRWRYDRLTLPIGPKVRIPFRFRHDFTVISRLEKKRKSDPTVIIPLLDAYDKLIKRIPPSRYPRLLAGFYLNTGNVYREWLTGDRTANLTQSISCYNEVLRIGNALSDSPYIALAQNNLGAAYIGLTTGDRTANLKQAIMCCQAALRFLTLESTPSIYALVQNNLGAAYLGLSTGDRTANLKQVIAHCQEALRFWTPKTDPSKYALAQSNLGIAYSTIPTGDRTANLKQAIACYQEALRFYTAQAAPHDYARVQRSLGEAYFAMPTGDRTANLKQAIACYQEALRFYTAQTDPRNYALTQSDLGAAYIGLLTGDRTANLEQAITHCQEALRFLTAEADPRGYALAQSNLGAAYLDLPTGDRTANLKQAIAYWRETLKVWTAEADPRHYALAQNNLGNAYRDLHDGNRAANKAQAIQCYYEALRIRTRDTAPLECLTTNRGLANLHFLQEEWQAALDAYLAAIDAGNQLYRAGLSSESKAAEVAVTADIYRHASFTAVRCGRVNEALLILEQGKTRLLTEVLRLRILRPANVPDETWIAFEEAGKRVRAVPSKDNNSDEINEKNDIVEFYRECEQKAQNAQNDLNAVIKHVQAYAPNFLQPLDLPTIQAQLPDEHTVFIAFCITDKGSIGLVVYRNRENVQVVELPVFTRTHLRRLLHGGRVTGGWQGAYIRSKVERNETTFKTWKMAIEDTLAELGRYLLEPLHHTLSPDIERIIFLPSSELFLFPLHAAPLSGDTQVLVCDRYQVSYVSSINVLANTRAKAIPIATPNLYTVINPEDDPRLFFTLAEGAAIVKLFTQYEADEGRAGTKQRVISKITGKTYVHFSCHGSYNRADPTQSGLALANDRLTLADLQRGAVDMSSVRLVTLSACETGIVDVVKGSAEEYVGLPAGFLLAGVPCVVSSLWAVPDLSTAILMERFYRNHLVDKMDFSTALQKAQVWVRELRIGEIAAYAAQCYQQSPQKDGEKKELLEYALHYRYLSENNPALRPFAHPYYWAAFTVNGV